MANPETRYITEDGWCLTSNYPARKWIISAPGEKALSVMGPLLHDITAVEFHEIGVAWTRILSARSQIGERMKLGS
jgi:hypothetical protein